MASILLFHHALGLTDGVRAFAHALRAAGHEVLTPDLFEGATFPTVEAGVAHAEGIGFDVITDRGVAAAAHLPANLVYAGFSLGVLPARKLAQTRPGAMAALLYHDALDVAAFGPWPGSVGLQVHLSEADPRADRDGARALVAQVPAAELHLYPGSAHLFTDTTSSEYDDGATRLVLERTIAFLGSR